MEELEESYGIGKKTAYDLFKKHNIKSMEELKNKVDSGEILVNDIIKKGLKYVGKLIFKYHMMKLLKFMIF